jgi:peptidoglycan/LPS O-acetylase OafA/YrhL
MRYIAALDGVRAFAVLAVFAQHAGVPGTGGAGIAVDVFFVLSGFLISGILLDEVKRSGRIDLFGFYKRRFLRLTPALLLTLLFYVLAAPHDVGSALISLFYLTDYARAFFVAPGPLSHTWSLAVEEHFYLIWPVALLWLCRLSPKKLIPLLIGLYALATAHRCGTFWIDGYDATYFRFDTRLSGLILGSLLAALLRSDLGREKVALASIGVGLGIAGTFALLMRDSSLTLGIAIAEAAALLTILTVVEGKEAPALTRVLTQPWLIYVGRISYGLYLFHHPMTFVLHDEMGMHWLLVTAITLPLSLALAALSYHFVERPVMEWGRKAHERARGVGFGEAAA